MLLEPHERERFCQYLRQNIESSQVIQGQLEKLPYGDHLVKSEKLRCMAWAIVLNDLESVEAVTIAG